jgi:arylsulfatase A
VTDPVAVRVTAYTRAVRQCEWKNIALRYPDSVAKLPPEERARRLEAWNADRRAKHLPIVTTDPTRPYSHLTPIPGGGHAEAESTGAYPGYYDADQLYDVARDPGERINRASIDSEAATRAKKLLAEFLATLPGTFNLFATPNDTKPIDRACLGGFSPDSGHDFVPPP